MSTHSGERRGAPTRGRARRAWMAGVVAVAVALSGLFTVPLAAQAATGDFTLTLDAPEQTGPGGNFNYSATLEFEGVDSANPATGVELTTVLPAGVTLASVPTGTDSPVESYTYDAATRTLVLTLKDTTQPLLTIVYTVSPVDYANKYEGMPLTTSITGTGGPSGPVTSEEVTTTVVGNNDYTASKGFEVVTGGDNRTVTYRFNVYSVTPYDSTTFTSWQQQLTDTFPAGAELVSTSGEFDGGSWDTSAWPTVTWTRNGQYGPDGNPLDRSGQRIWVTVRYPATVPGWEDGERPPVNTVGLDTRDANGVAHEGDEATVQGPSFQPHGGTGVVGSKSEGGATSAGYLSHLTYTGGSYVGPSDAPDIDQLVLTDSGATGSPNASWFSHTDIQQIFVTFSTGLAAEDLPYRLEYQINGSSAWNEFTDFTTSSGRTGESLVLAVQNTGSAGWQANAQQDVLNLPVGSTLTGWRLTIAPGAETVPVSSEAKVRMGFQPVFRTVADGIQPSSAPAGTSPGPQTNTVTVTGGDLTGEASSTLTPTDSVYVTTTLSGPGTLSVGGASGDYLAAIVNQNPSETYTDSELRVVLPCGVFYDTTQAITPVQSPLVGIPATPALGAGATVDTTGRVTGADGCEQQVVRFAFDELPPMRAPATANDRSAENSGWRYRIPVIALAQAYDPDNSTLPAYSYATVADPRFLSEADGGTAAATVPMVGYGPFFGDDVYDFDPARSSVGVALSNVSINTAGGLLISKLSSASETGPWALESEVGATSFWQIYVNDILPNPVSGAVFFDKLPSVADGDDFDTRLAGAVTGAPDGATVEYSTDATSATTGTWTSTAEGATAFRVSVPTLTSGSDFTLTVPTENLGDLTYGQRDTNTVSATATYGGTPVQFGSNEAAVTVVAAPSLSLLKKTNGVEYSAAPGASVAVGSEVTWTYEVTNTGDVALDEVAVSDAFTDGAGDTGTLTATSTATGPLLPGETRTFQATGTAVLGQYQNTATATATAVDGDDAALPQQPEPATDDSWYRAGASGLSIVKTTNGEDVDSAPGLWLTPGSEVEWAYTVTNTGELALTDVVVTDVDADGEAVFTDVIDSLESGESVTLTATGTAIVGQYHNTVTAEADDPAGEGTLSSADDSWYFGVESGISVDKLVSTSEDGPWTETVEVASGTATYWQITVTNTGNAPLTDVVLDDPQLDERVEVGDLVPGESRVVVLELDRTTVDITNVATATGNDPLGGTIIASDDARATVGDEDDGLAVTGGVLATGVLVVALGLIGAGVLLVIRRRRAIE
ncbi:DUF7507 domain-containing protein [Microbacterium sp. TNHR37B]|uniref:DUF7507 domain-containing protein n=1 Tax=Microbacterium sp. TNHR37B TaxID=1775956 RepID=UPI0007B30E97|nr:CARDB domain-containing protein [Microbacterium sp. TNHR37B]KZE89429.1 hypothetical protein AVP41_02223 [Microbacterium sp. TNHR37B]